MPAIPAGPIHSSDPGRADPRSERQLWSIACGNLSHDLVARDQRVAMLRKFPFHDVEVGAAYATGAHTQKDMTAQGRAAAHQQSATDVERSLLANSGPQLSYNVT